MGSEGISNLGTSDTSVSFAWTCYEDYAAETAILELSFAGAVGVYQGSITLPEQDLSLIHILQRAALHIADGLCRIDAICAIVIIHIDLADFHSILGAVQHNLAAPHGIDLGAARLLCAGVVLNGARCV